MDKKDCCGEQKEYDGKNWFKAISYALIPHVGCIAFIMASVLGVTVLMQYFKPLLMSRNIFYYLILVSIGFATISSFFYLKRQGALSVRGVKEKKGYLSVMYGSTVGINILLFFFIFPFLANFTGASVDDASGLSLLKISVDIPCPGHAPLISNELSTIKGVEGVEYSFPDNFDVYYSGVEVDEILGLEVFDEYPATVIERNRVESNVASASGSCSGGCGGPGTCGGSCGSPSCNY